MQNTVLSTFNTLSHLILKAIQKKITIVLLLKRYSYRDLHVNGRTGTMTQGLGNVLNYDTKLPSEWKN